MPPRPLYKVTFASAGKIYELYAREVASSSLWGFVEIAELVWDAEGVVIDPTEERLRDEFGSSRRLHLPMHAVLRVEEVERRGQLAIRDSTSGDRIVTPFPLPGKR
jgi:hypothetical protein